MTIVQLSIFVENKTGRLVEALEALSGGGVDLRALSLADTSDFGILRIIVDKPPKALEVLRAGGYLVKTSQVVAIAVGDEPGGLAKTLRILADNEIDVEYTYAFVAHSRESAYVILRLSDNDAALEILAKNNVPLLSAEQVYGM